MEKLDRSPQINSFTGIFNCILSPPMLPQCIDLSPPPSNFEEPPMFSTPVGNPENKINIIF